MGPPDALITCCKPSSSHECLVILGWRRWEEGGRAGEGNGVLKGWGRGGAGEGDGVLEGWGEGSKIGESGRERRDCLFNNGHGMGIIATAYAGGVSGGGVV